jgi:CheY-like chemotaxis protein
LPDLDGLEVTRRLREWTRTPILVLSARGQDEDKINALDAGAEDYLTKPFSVAAFCGEAPPDAGAGSGGTNGNGGEAGDSGRFRLPRAACFAPKPFSAGAFASRCRRFDARTSTSALSAVKTGDSGQGSLSGR